MKAELREQLGKAAYDVDLRSPSIHSPKGVVWENQSLQTQERYRDMAEAVVQELGEIVISQLQYIAMALTDCPVEFRLGEKVAQWPKEESNP
jgi:hypothetical protein